MDFLRFEIGLHSEWTYSVLKLSFFSLAYIVITRKKLIFLQFSTKRYGLVSGLQLFSPARPTTTTFFLSNSAPLNFAVLGNHPVRHYIKLALFRVQRPFSIRKIQLH